MAAGGAQQEMVSVAVSRDLLQAQERVFEAVGLQAGGSNEAQTSLVDLHKACKDIIGVPQVLLAMQSGDEGVYDTSLPVSELPTPTAPEERVAKLKELARAPILEAPPLEADVLKSQLAYVADPERYWKHQCEIIEHFFLTRKEELRIQRQQVLCRWFRFCSTSDSKEAARRDLETSLARIDQDLVAATERSGRMLQHPATDEKRLASRDLIEYHRHAVRTNRMQIRVRRLMKTLEWMAHRSGGELLLRAKTQIRDSADEAFEREGTVRDGVPLMTANKKELDGMLRLLIDDFGVEEADAETDPMLSDGTLGAIEEGDAAEDDKQPGRTVDLLDESRESDLLSMVKAIFLRVHREQTPQLRFPPYGSAVAKGGQDPAVLTKSKEVAIEGKTETRDHDETSMATEGVAIGMETVHLKTWDAPDVADSHPPPVSTGWCNNDVTEEVREQMAACLAQVERVDARLLGEANYIDEPSTHHAQNRVREAAERHQNIALVIKGVLPPPSLEENPELGILTEEKDHPPALSTPKLQSYYYLRAVQIREAKRRILMNLNFFRSVQRTLAGEAKHAASGSEFDSEQVSSTYDTYFCTDDGLPCVQDLSGVKIVYDKAIEDCEALCNHLLLLGTHHIALNRDSFGESDALFYVDTMAVLADLLCSEAAYQDAKRATVETYFEAFQHVSVPAYRAELSSAIIDCIKMRPKLNMNAAYFTEGYAAEVVVCNLRSTLLKRIAADQIEKERMMHQENLAGAIDVTLVPCGEAICAFEFYSSLGTIAQIAKLLNDVVTRTIRSFSLGRLDLKFDATLLTALESAVVQETMMDWHLLEQQELIAQSSVHITANAEDQEGEPPHMQVDRGGSHSLEDPVLIDNTDALEIIITEMRAELHGGKKTLSAERRERETREIWVNALHVFSLRNLLLAGLFETNVLAATYKTQLDLFRIGARSSVEELKAARTQGGEVPTLAVDYLPNLAISEFDESFCAPDLQTRHGMKRLLSTNGVYQLRVATELQLAHRALLAVTIDYNHGAVCQLALPSIMEAGGSDEPVDESKDKKLKECFLSIHRFKGALKDRLLKDYTLKSKNETSVQRNQEIMYGLMEDYCSWMLERCRGFSAVAQVCAAVQHVRWLARRFKPSGDGVFNVTVAVKEAEDDEEDKEVPVGEEAKKKAEEEMAARAPTRSAADIADMKKFFASDGPDYDLWCLPEHYSIMAVPEKDRSAGTVHSEEGICLRYFTVNSLATMLRALYLRHSLATTAEQTAADPNAVTKAVADDMRRLRFDSSQLGSGATPTEVTQYAVNRAAAVWLTQLHAVTEWRGTLERRHREDAVAVVRRVLSCRGCVSLQPYLYGSYCEWPAQVHTEVGQCACQQQLMEKQLFGTDGMTNRGMLQQDQLSHMVSIAAELEAADRAAFGEVLPKTAKDVLEAAAAEGVKPPQAAKFCEVSLDYTTIHAASDQLRVAFMSQSTSPDPAVAYEEDVIKGTVVRGPGVQGPAELLLAQIAKASHAIAMQQLRTEAQSMRKAFSMLSGHSTEDIPAAMRWPGAEARFKDKVSLVAKTMEEIKSVAEFMVNEDGEQTVILTESDLESKMDALARELRKWSEEQIATVRSTERSDAAHIERLLHIQEHKTKYTEHAMSLLKKSFARRVEAEIIDRNYQQLLDNDRLRRALHLQNEQMEQQEPIIRKKVRVEYNDLVTELTMKLAASKARFREFHMQMTQDTLHSLSEVKRDTIKGMAEHKSAPSGFKSRAPSEIATLTVAESKQLDETQSQRAIMKIKGLYHLKEINMKMKLRAMMDELESQEQKRREAVGDGREQLEEKILMQEEQLAETRALLNTTEIELKSCREELAMTYRSKHKLVQWKMGAKKRLSELESAGADADAAQRHYERLQADAEKTKAELAALSGIEQRAEQRNAVVELKTSKQLQRMRTTLRKEQRLKLQAYSRLEEVISDVSLGQSSVRHEEADVWLGKYQACRRALEKSLRDNELLMNSLRANGVAVPDALRSSDIFGDTQSSFGVGDSLTLPPTRSSMSTAGGRERGGGRISPVSLSTSGGLIGRPHSRGSGSGTPAGERTFTTGSKFRISTG